MPLKKFLIPAIIIVITLLVCSGNTQADCKAGDPTGYFQGTAKSQQAGELAISLNLLCTNGKYGGELATPLGNFTFKGGSFTAGLLQLQFDAGGDLGSIEVRFDGRVFRGTFRLTNDTGPIELRRVGAPKLAIATGSALHLSTAQWREDLKYFARELAKRHANAFHFISRERFEAEVEKLNHQLDHLNTDEVYVGMDTIANLIGDGHTYVEFPSDTAEFPLIIRKFDEEYRVAFVAPGLESALGTRLTKIQDVPVERAAAIIMTMTPQDETVFLRQARTTSFLRLGMVLHGFGIIPDRNSARYTLADDNGKEFTVEVRALAPDAKIKWVSAAKELPLVRQRAEESFWYTYLSDHRSVYCNFRGYEALDQQAKGLFQLLKEQPPDKLIIDMRQNDGGDYTEGLKHLIHPIRDLPSINSKGHLFVIIGPNTFSAAMANAAQFRSQTAAILVGQPIGEKPNSYQEPRQATLPNSRLLLRYSTQFYKFVESGENIVRPDQEIKTSWADFKAGRDPVVEWVFKYSAAP